MASTTVEVQVRCVESDRDHGDNSFEASVCSQRPTRAEITSRTLVERSAYQ